MKKRRFSTFKNIDAMQWVRIIAAVLTVVLGTLYIWQVNISATHGFAMQDLEQDIERLELENERLEMEAAKLQSVASVRNRIQMLGMQKISEIQYVEVTSPEIALK